MQWSQDPNKSNADNPNDVRREASRHFRNKNKKYLKAKIEELESNRKIRDLYKGNIDVKKGYQSRTNILRDGKGDLVTDSQSILARWRNHFSQLLNVLVVNEVRHTEIHTEEPLLDETIAFELEMAIEKLKRHKSPDIDQIQAELIKAGVTKIHSGIHKLIISIWSKEELIACGE